MCAIDSIFSNLLIGAVGSLIASGIFLQYTRRKGKAADKEKYAKASGTYIGYGPKSEGGSTINQDRPLSNVEIIHLGGNLLQLTLKEINDPHEWQGLISMESNHYGTLIWRYKKLHGKEVDMEEHRFGLKKFVFYPKDNKKVAYLMGDIQAGYFSEFLIESNK